MGVTIDKERAIQVFGQALALAHADTALPEEWLERTRRVHLASSMTFTPVLGTALLAKATDRLVDAFSLREGESDRSYSARSLAKEVLVPCCVRAGIDIRTRGLEPLNNNPFFSADRISRDLKVKPKVVVELGYLCECLERLELLDDRSAREGLAAFLRTRLELSKSVAPIKLAAGTLSLPELVSALDEFTAGDTEGGKTGQALVAAILDLVFADVRMKAIRDPSSKWPGDVGAFLENVQTLGVEVRQRPFSEPDVLLFAQRLQENGVRRGFVAGFDQGDAVLEDQQLRFQAHRLYGVELSFFDAPGALLVEACRFAAHDMPISLAMLPRRVTTRMFELEVGATRIDEWAALFVASDE